jgi:SAM-dependent methyltransferase
MSTMQQQTPASEAGAAPDAQEMSAAVEEQMGKIVTELGAALGVLLTSLGTRSGLWAALAGAGPLTTAEVAAKVSVDPSLVREWLRAQAAGGYLEYDPVTGTFTLPDAVAAAICHGPGGALVDAAATMFSSMGEGFAAFSEAFSTGQGFGWHQRTAAHWHGTDAFTRVALPAELIEAAIGEMAGVAAVLAAGGSVADVGCGYGTPTMAIAALFPAARILGIDYHDASIAHSRAEAARRGAGPGAGTVRFEVAAASGLPGHGYDLITFFDSLHDIGDPLGALTRARAAIAPAGAVLLVEPLGADDVADNLNPAGRMFYAVSTLACTPNAVSQKTATSSEPLGLAGQQRLRALAAEAGFGRVRRLDVPAPMNLVLELRP